MTAVLAGPQTETIVVLGCEDNALHSCLAGYTGPLLTVKVRGRKHVRILVTCPPLTICKCVGAEVYEHIVLHLLPLHLGFRRYGTIGGRDRTIIARSRHRKRGDGCQENIYASSHIVIYAASVLLSASSEGTVEVDGGLQKEILVGYHIELG